VGDFIPKPGFLYLFRSRNTFPTGKRKIQDGQCAKFYPQQWVFSQIRNERFQGNPGILLAFFTVYGFNF
jgi:hypothetical protein